jgi:hypothetical protein
MNPEHPPSNLDSQEGPPSPGPPPPDQRALGEVAGPGDPAVTPEPIAIAPVVDFDLPCTD